MPLTMPPKFDKKPLFLLQKLMARLVFLAWLVARLGTVGHSLGAERPEARGLRGLRGPEGP